jgi:hypothetical protein
MKTVLAQQFLDEPLESLVISEDLEYSLPGTYARGVLKRGSMHTAVIAVSEKESPDTIGKVLSFGLVRLERLRAASKIRGTLSGLRVILPAASVVCLPTYAAPSPNPSESARSRWIRAWKSWKK